MENLWNTRKKTIAYITICCFILMLTLCIFLQHYIHGKSVILSDADFKSPDSSIAYSIDTIQKTNGYVYIDGWVLNQKQSERNLADIVLYDLEQGEYIMFPTSSMPRPDLVTRWGDSYTDCGFSSAVKYNSLTSSYRICILYKGMNSDKAMLVATEQYLSQEDFDKNEFTQTEN